jgi:opacity protein-like surface antigen
MRYFYMRKFLLAAAATAALAAPAAARDGSPYVGIEGGLLLPRDLNGDANVDFTATPATPAVVGGGDFGYNNAFDAELKRGWDVDLIAGYDFGGFRLEGELGWKRADREGFDADPAFLTALNTGLNRPSAPPDPGAPGQAALTDTDFGQFDGKVTVRSAMINLLGDFGADDGMSFYGGVGFGRAWARALNDGDSAWAWQGILGARTAISENIDIGLKYRYFRTGNMNFVGGPIAFGGNPNRIGTIAVPVNQTNNAAITPSLDGKFRSHSLLASLTFNFGAPAAPAPVYTAPPPAPAAPATQTCPDGSVILATDACPVPPPPPPPAPAGERG